MVRVRIWVRVRVTVMGMVRVRAKARVRVRVRVRDRLGRGFARWPLPPVVHCSGSPLAARARSAAATSARLLVPALVSVPPVPPAG